jgi:cytochrome c oxidase subunit 3
MTGLHAIHVLVGIVILSVLAWGSWHRPFSEHYYTPMEMSGLYWHFVDIVWVFLYPLLYLINRHLT